jgi:ATP-dependent helicase HrpB
MHTLPITKVLPDILKALENHKNLVLVAPPGAGKTTRVPLAFLEAPWAKDKKIILVEPRRLATRASAHRMADQLGEKPGDTVGYRVRMETRISEKTRLEIVTPGVLNRMMLDEPGLDNIAAIVFDEIHERSLDTDFGFALALDIQKGLRDDLKLIAMSATVDGARIASLMDNAQTITSEGRIFPVETLYRPRRPEERLEDAVAHIILSESSERKSSILVFLPGEGEIRRVAERLQGKLPQNITCHPLYGQLDPKAQDAAIRPAPQGQRKIVLATSIAETSLTIEGINLVIDSGYARTSRFDPASGLSRLETVRVSRAEADQRRGRAGRLSEGTCIRLWSEGQNGALEAYRRPEILEADLASLVLDCASWGVHKPDDLTWLDPPPLPAWQEAVSLLQSLQALDKQGRMTPEGEALRVLPMHPRLAHMIHSASENDKALAADMAVLLSEPGLGGRSTDMRDRLKIFWQDKSQRAQAARLMARRWIKTNSTQKNLENCGALLSLAYPDRIAKARGANGRYLLANGKGAIMDEADPLTGEQWLVVAEAGGKGAETTIRLAAPISKADIEALHAHSFRSELKTSFDKDKGTVKAEERTMLGAMTWATKPVTLEASQLEHVFLSVIERQGLSILPRNDSTTTLQQRLHWLHQQDEDWPAFDEVSLSSDLQNWLPPYLAGINTLNALDLTNAILGRLSWEQQSDLDTLAPQTLALPDNRQTPIHYNGERAPSISVRAQDLYGLDQHPKIFRNRIPLTIELLSPARRPVQITQDLPAFWRGSWADVRKDMKARYPKHNWPEKPWEA